MWMKKLEEEANADRESLESGRGSLYAFPIHLESVGGYEEAGWTRGISNGAASPTSLQATQRPRDGTRHRF